MRKSIIKSIFFLSFIFFFTKFIASSCAQAPGKFLQCLPSSQSPISPTIVDVFITQPPSSTPALSQTPTITLSPTPSTSSPPTADLCQLKMGSGARSKVDLVILPEDYTSQTEFLADVDKAVNALKRTNLGQARLDKINVWALLDLTQTYFQGFDCPSPGGRTVACWDHMKALNYAMSACGGDTYIILNNDTHRVGSVAGVAIWGGTYIYKFGLEYPTVPHELGHSMIGLMDEYSFGFAAPAGSSDSINCSNTGSANESTPCPKWVAKFPNTGCYRTCGFTNFYRPMQKSIMDRGGANAVWEFNEPSLIDGWDEILKYFQ